MPDVPLTLVPVSPGEAFELLRGGGADAGFVRLPVDRTDLSAIPLYTETTVVVIPKDHVIAAVDEVTAGDLADETVLHPLDDTLPWESLSGKTSLPGKAANERPATTADAIELVAAGIGVLVVPQSLARLHHRKDLTYRPLTEAPESRVALSWPEDATTDLVEDFIGIVRGRTVNSSRGRTQTPPAASAADQSKRKSPDKGAARRKPTAGKPTGKPTGKTGKPAGKSGKSARGGSGGSGGASKGGKRGKPGRRS
nr:LysR family substrate-binding domain-containing protein [Streptomyces sp. BA2]